MAGGFHSTSPVWNRVALVARVTSKLPSALVKKRDNFCVETNCVTYCKGQCQASKYDPKEHEAYSPLHTPQGSIVVYSLSRTAPPKGWWS